ncbi:transposase [Acetobacter orientalis]|uniref:Transposase n=1 Tax=Acetobacter orientalis TaxID=146474 RepID=A0A2Z5ZH65_9PROT|nr:transposase [Acetobacter orientalis]
MADITRKTKRYLSDLTDEAWERIAPHPLMLDREAARREASRCFQIAGGQMILKAIRRLDAAKGFEVLPRRWVVEHTFGWMTHWRRLVKDYEQRIDVPEAMIHIAMESLALRRNAHP